MGLGVGKWGAILEFRREKKHSCRERVRGGGGDERDCGFLVFFFSWVVV